MNSQVALFRAPVLSLDTEAIHRAKQSRFVGFHTDTVVSRRMKYVTHEESIQISLQQKHGVIPQ